MVDAPTTTAAPAPSKPFVPSASVDPVGHMKAETPKPDAPVRPDAPAKEPTVQERLEALLVSMRNNAKHNAPVSPAHVAELESIVMAGGGKVAAVTHDLAKHVLIGKPDGAVVVAYTAEDALDYVRALPADVRDRAYWVVAEKSLLAAIDSGGDAGAATTAFAEALAEDRKTAPVTRKPDELLPDGRIREDRFADRRPPPPPGAAGSPQVADAPKAQAVPPTAETVAAAAAKNQAALQTQAPPPAP